MTKLSKTQEEVLDKIKNYIKNSKQYATYEEKVLEEKVKPHNEFCLKHGYNPTTLEKEMEYEERYRKYYDNAVNHNIALCTANSKTLKKLEELGYIEILNEGGSYPDTVKLLTDI